jgi:predicted nucleic acid-binding protein
VGLKVYLDACALNRLRDEKVQPRVIAEAEAVEKILHMTLSDGLELIASDVLRMELNRNGDEDKRYDALELLEYASEIAAVTPEIRLRALSLAAEGYGPTDALHLAVAESKRVDALLTTDDRFIAKAVRGAGNPLVRVMNPVKWYEEVTHGAN